MQHMSMYIASYAVIVVLNYLVGFILLSVVYWKILKLIKKVKRNFGKQVSCAIPFGLALNCMNSSKSPFSLSNGRFLHAQCYLKSPKRV